jgi:hypothetical protein
VVCKGDECLKRTKHQRQGEEYWIVGERVWMWDESCIHRLPPPSSLSMRNVHSVYPSLRDATENQCKRPGKHSRSMEHHELSAETIAIYSAAIPMPNHKNVSFRSLLCKTFPSRLPHNRVSARIAKFDESADIESIQTGPGESYSIPCAINSRFEDKGDASKNRTSRWWPSQLHS